MDIQDIMHPALSEGSRGRALRGLHELYARIAASQAAFRLSFAAASRRQAGGAPGEAAEGAAASSPPAGLSCPAGCGECCEGFLPDLLPLEAEYLAAWLLRNRPELAASPEALAEAAAPPCPFYDGGNPAAHCGVYPARPLICRLFAFSASRDKGGEPTFALCRRMPELEGLPGRSLRGEALLALAGAELPIMADFASRLLALDPSGAARRLPLGAALAEALGKLGLILRFLPSEEGGRDDDEPEPNAPAPKAA